MISILKAYDFSTLPLPQELLDNEIAKVLSFILELRVSSHTNLRTILGAQRAALITVQVNLHANPNNFLPEATV